MLTCSIFKTLLDNRIIGIRKNLESLDIFVQTLQFNILHLLSPLDIIWTRSF
jgi:hypothetical protein